MPYRAKLGPRPNGIKGDRQKGLPWTVWRSSVHAKHVQDANGCHHRCAGLPPPQHVCLWGMRQLIGSVKAFLRGADPAPLEVNAGASLYFKGTVLTLYYMPWQLSSGVTTLCHPKLIITASAVVSVQARGVCIIFFPKKKYSEGFQHFMMFLIINCQKT